LRPSVVNHPGPDKYAQTYLVSFAYWFEHRFDSRDLIATLIVEGARIRPMPEKESEASMVSHVSNQEPQ
jgi:hypothetical protein